MVDALVVTKRLNKLREYIGFLNEIRLKSREQFVTDPFVYGNAERFLQLAIQAILDIGNHILADRKLKEPEEYRDVMKILGEEGLLPRGLVEKLLPLVGLRNILVHEAEKSIDWIEILTVLWSSRKLIAYVTGAATVLSIIISLLLPEYFKSTVTLLPETEKSKLAALGGISDLAALAGVSVGSKASLPKFHIIHRKENSHVRG